MRALKFVLAVLGGLIGGYVVALGVGLVAFEVFSVSQREGAAAMGLAFFIAPTAALVAAVVAGVWYLVRSRPAGP